MDDKPPPFANQKLLARLLKACGELERPKTRGPVRYGRRVGTWLPKAMALRDRRATMPPHGYVVLRGQLQAELVRLLACYPTDPDGARLAKLLRKHQTDLLKLLENHGLDAANTLEEREIPPGVFTLKLSIENRTEVGAETHTVLKLILRI